MIKNNHFLNSQIITYLGNKRKLIPYIKKNIIDIKKKLKKEKIVCMDGFSGSGIVSRLLKEHSCLLVTNDIESYCETLNRCFLTNRSEVDYELIKSYIDFVNDENNYSSCVKFIEKHYCPKNDSKIEPGERVFYTRKNGYIIDNIRNLIKNQIPQGMTHHILAPLLVKASINVNTSGIFNSFYKKEGIGHFGGKNENSLDRIKKYIKLDYPLFSNNECPVIVKREDINDLVKTINSEIDSEFDVVYYDPPYNKHPYGTFYFMLNVINNWDIEKPVPNNFRGQDNSWFRSKYNSRRWAENVFEDLIKNTKSKYIVISYNNRGIIPIDKFRQILEKYGELEIVTIEHGTYNRLIGQSAYKKIGLGTQVSEFLWILKCC